MFVGLFAALAGYFMAATSFSPGEGAIGILPWWNYVKKRAARILPAYFVWTLVYIAFGFVFDYFIRHGINPRWFEAGCIERVVFLGRSSTQLWFLICLFYAQVISAFLFLLLARMRWDFWVVAGMILTIASACLDPSWFARYPLRVFAFLVTGYGVGKVDGVGDSKGVVSWGLVLAAALAVHFFVRTAMPIVLRDWLVAVPLLVFALKIRISSRWIPVARVLGNTSMCVFLVHPLFAAGFRLPVWRFFAEPYGVLPVALDWLCIWTISFLVSLMLFRVPVMKNFVR